MEGIVKCTVVEGKGGCSGRYWRGVVENMGGCMSESCHVLYTVLESIGGV